MKVITGQTNLYNLVIKKKTLPTFEQPGVKPISLIQTLMASLYPVIPHKLYCVRYELPKILEHINITADIIFCMKYQLNKNMHT